MFNLDYIDAVIRRQVFLERLKASQYKEYDKVLSDVEKAFLLALALYNVEKVSDLTKRQLSIVTQAITKAVSKANLTFEKSFLLWLRELSGDETKYHTETLNGFILDADVPIEPTDKVWSLVKNTTIAAYGLTILQSLASFRRQQTKRIITQIRMAHVLKWTMFQLKTEILGTQARAFKDGLIARMKRAATTIIGTAIQHGATLSSAKVLSRFAAWVSGYEWVSVLDGKTSNTCKSLDGRQFEIGNGPLPPIHPNCRSTISAIFKDATKFKKGLTRRAASGSINAGATYYTWLRTQTKKFQIEALGPTRAKLFAEGGISAKEFGRLNLNRKFEPLTLDELRKKKPEMFERANI